MRLAVLGVGLIGGSIGLAARQRLDAEVAGFDSDPRERRTRLSRWARSTVRPPRSPRRSTGAEIVFCAAPIGALPRLVAEALAAERAGRRGHRRRLDQGGAAGGTVQGVGGERFIGGHPLAGAETDGVENATRRPVRGRALVPDPDRALERRPLRPPAACDRRTRRPAPGDRRREPRQADGDGEPRPPRDRQRPRPRGGRRRGRGVRAASGGGAELSRHDPGRRRQSGHLGRHLRDQPRRGRPRGRGDLRAPAARRPS